MDVVLTGGTGFIGQALVATVLRRGWGLRAVVRDPESPASRWIASQGGSLVRGDVTEPDGLADVFSGADLVLHNAGVYEFGVTHAAAARMRAVNVEGTDNVLRAAMSADVPRTVYVSTVWALGPTGPASQPSIVRDERQQHSGRYTTSYEESKALAHQAALRWRDQGLPLVIVMPHGVVGANDHSVFGYLLRLTLLGRIPPISWGKQTTYSLVDAHALAEGICLAAELAAPGEDYLFCGPSMSLGELMAIWGRLSGRRVPRWYLPRGMMRPQMALAEPLLRMLKLPAFLSRDVVDVTRWHLDYSSDKAVRDLGWSHPEPEQMWKQIIEAEQALLAQRKGFRDKLRHVSVIERPP